jgi:hypothetical protein
MFSVIPQLMPVDVHQAEWVTFNNTLRQLHAEVTQIDLRLNDYYLCLDEEQFGELLKIVSAFILGRSVHISNRRIDRDRKASRAFILVPNAEMCHVFQVAFACITTGPRISRCHGAG